MPQDASTNVPMRDARRALLAQLDKAIEGFGKLHAGDHVIHEIRKELKGARATLRLLRGCLGAAKYRRENALIRDAARPLTPVRDAKVLLEVLRRTSEGTAGAGSFLRYSDRALRAQRSDAQKRLSAGDLSHSARVLRAVRRRMALLPEARIAQGKPGPALVRAYKACRRAFARAHRRHTDVRLHEWRKQTKYFANQLAVVLPFAPKRFARTYERAGRLAGRLGDDHDLALLTGQIVRHAANAHAPARADEIQHLVRGLSRRRKALQRDAFRLGRRLYSDKPRRYRL